jgi:hypothetical protein
MLGPSIPQHFVPLRGSAAPGHELVYEPMVLAAGRVLFADRKTKLETSEELVTLTPLSTAAVALDWADAMEADLDLGDLGDGPEGAARYGELPGAATKKASYAAWKREFKDWLYRNRTLELYKSLLLKEYSRPGESEHDFRLRLSQEAREARDKALEKLRKKYAPKLATLQERVRRAEQAVEREAEQAKDAKLQTAISVGATLLGAMLGRKAVSRSSVGRATTAARGVGRSMKQAQDVHRARATVEATVERLAELEAEFEAETEQIREKYDPALEDLETVVVRPKKKDIAVQLVALAWAPHWQRGGEVAAAWE